MKLSELHALKEATLAHNQIYPTKEFSKQQQYKSLKDLILERIGLIEGIEIKKQKYLEDINTYLKRLKEKFEINLMPEEEPVKPSEGSESLIPHNGRQYKYGR